LGVDHRLAAGFSEQLLRRGNLGQLERDALDMAANFGSDLD